MASKKTKKELSMSSAMSVLADQIRTFGIFIMIEVIGFMFLLKAYTAFNWEEAAVGLFLVCFGAVFDYIVWSRQLKYINKKRKDLVKSETTLGLPGQG